MKKSTPHKTRLGIFVVVGTLTLIAALYFIGNRQHLFSKNIEVYAVFQNVNGLLLGNNVRYSGINVGTVGGIEMVDESTIEVLMMIEEKTGAYIKKDAIATIGTDGLVGSMVVNILPGKENLMPVNSGDTITTYSKIGSDDMLSTLNVTNENAALLTADLLKITNKILAGEGTFGALINDTILAEDIRKTILNLKHTTNGADKLVMSLNQEISKIDLEETALGVLINDTIVGQQTKQMISNLEQSSNDFSETTQKLEEMIYELDSTENTLKYLMTDEDLPFAIDSTMQEIQEASKKLNENLEALKHNVFFRRYFKKQDRAATKKR